MLSKNKIKLIRSLELKKYRDSEKIFLAEGHKLIVEMLHSSFRVIALYATSSWLFENNSLKNLFPDETLEINTDEIKKISLLKSPQEVLALVQIPSYTFSMETIKDSLVLCLDTIQDPGNLGTIIRLADWFGIENIICSYETADVYSPKVVQSTMGSISRVKIHYLPLEQTLMQAKKINIPIIGTTLSGENIYKTELPQKGIIIMGNESKGINERLLPLLSNQLFIPGFPENLRKTESLNVGIAAAIICAEFRRRMSI